jgi:ABC-type lipoprotein release transport system permease subunit
MRGSLITRFAVRSLGRNGRRTLLSVIGIGVGCMVALFIAAFTRGTMEMRVRSIAESGYGHLRIAPAGWDVNRDPDLRIRDWRRELDAVESIEGIEIVAPHARTTALLAFGTRVVGVEMLGVDPVAERKLNRLVRAIQGGRYLVPGDTGVTVIGSTIAGRLDVELDDDLFLTVANRGGDMEYAMLRIVGIVYTGSRDIDASICHVTLADVQRFTGYEGASEITVAIDEPRDVDRIASKLKDVILEGNEVLTWKEVLPEQGGDAESDRAFMNLFAGIVILVCILGVTSAQMTAIMERKREFAVLMALGMQGFQVIRLLLVEAAAMGILGAMVGLVLATPLVWHTATVGIDFESLLKMEFTVSNVLFDPVLYADMGAWMVPYALFISLVSTITAALYPAWYAMRTNPTSALSLREV